MNNKELCLYLKHRAEDAAKEVPGHQKFVVLGEIGMAEMLNAITRAQYNELCDILEQAWKKPLPNGNSESGKG